ncbi:MAG: O-antigen ligase family protein [Cyclobacteriaceae bacterium]|nr:O-antigen ligase family protein [Cyclobacteriaceae bacterium]
MMNVFTSKNDVRFFTKFWLAIALLAALYGMHQEHVGFTSFEIRSASANGGLKPIWGRIRKWSFLSDVSAFGLFMSYSATICFILSLGPFKIRDRIILVVSGILMYVSMTYSGTRTAFATLFLGLAFYVFLSLNNRKTLIFASLFAFVFVALVYGPFYGPTFSRMRSLFNYEEDASMGVRDGKRVRLQPYARENPFGGGLNTAGNVGLRYEPNHPMAGQFDPDSGYLRMALERGWIGLIINFTLYTLVLIYGIHNYHRSNDKEVKIYYAAYMAAYFALTIAHFTQDAMDQKPVVVVIMSSYAIFVRLIEIEKIKQKKIPSI